MRLRLGDIEMFNMPGAVSNELAQQFVVQLPNDEQFEFPGSTRPKSLLLTTVELTGPRSGMAKGLLLRVGGKEYDLASQAASDDAGVYDAHELALRFCVGILELHLEPVHNVSLIAKAL